MDAPSSTPVDERATALPSRPRLRPAFTLTAVAALALLVLGVAGRLGAGWGYALFAVSCVAIVAGVVAFAAFSFTKAGDAHLLRSAAVRLLGAGAAAYILAVAALAGYYVHETLAGRMEWHWILFGPAALAALVVLDVGLYRKLVANNLPTWRRYRQYITRDRVDKAALSRTFVDEVVLHRSLWRASRVRWLRHTLIFWGFVAMFAIELVAVVLRDGFPAFGWRDVWREPGHPVRLAFDFAYDLTGCMVLAGCVIALGWRIAVNGTPERKFSDTPTTVFLLLVVASGFLLEATRIAASVGDPVHAYSFAGRALAATLPASWSSATSYQSLWLLHVLGSCLFIAYVPVRRLVHSCATPFGRLMNSQQGMLAAKKRGVLGAMLAPRASAPHAPD